MAISEKFCLKWKDYQDNVNNAFAGLRKDSEFANVTLACQDGHQIEAHKVILAAFSPFFKELLKRNKHSYPLIYMRGIKSEDLLGIVDFLYYGEANICHANLDNFLKIAKELQLKGLNGSEDGIGGEDIEYPPNQTDKSPISGKQRNNGTFGTKTAFISQSPSGKNIMPTITLALPKQELIGDMNELDKQNQDNDGSK